MTIEMLARKWCPLHGWTIRSRELPIGGIGCWCQEITADMIAAVREALLDAEGRIGALYQPQRGLIYVDKAIAALRGGTG